VAAAGWVVNILTAGWPAGVTRDYTACAQLCTQHTYAQQVDVQAKHQDVYQPGQHVGQQLLYISFKGSRLDRRKQKLAEQQEG
jgi:hypothetical protein